MCFAFRATTSAEDQELDDILAMNKVMRLSNMRRPATPTARAQASPVSDKSSSDDCVEVAPPEKALSIAYQKLGSVQQASKVKRTKSKNTDDYEEGENNEDMEMEESTTTAATSRKRPGSALVNRSAKKVKTAVLSHEREPTIKGDAYDDLLWRAKKMAREKEESIAQLTLELEEIQDERDIARTTVTNLQKKLKTLRASEAVRDTKDMADLKAAVQEMKVTLRGESEKKHKSNDKLKKERHKEDLARARYKMEEAQDAAKDAKALAKNLKPVHSSIVQAREKEIASLKEAKTFLEVVTDKLKNDKAKLKADKESLSKALAQQSDEISDLQGEIKKLEDKVNEDKAARAIFEKKIAGTERAWAADQRSRNEKWQIQYDNAQNSARRASNIQSSMSTTTRALNEAIGDRDQFQIKLKDAEAEIRMLRSSISKGDGCEQKTEE